MILTAAMVLGGSALVGKYFITKRKEAKAEELAAKVADQTVKTAAIPEGEALGLGPLHIVLKNGIKTVIMGKASPFIFEAVLQQMGSLNSPAEVRAKVVGYFQSKAPDVYAQWQKLRQGAEAQLAQTYYPLVAMTVKQLSSPTYKP